MKKSALVLVMVLSCVFTVPAQAGIFKKMIVIGGAAAAGKAIAKHQEKKKIQQAQR